jgi:hypothetical protein
VHNLANDLGCVNVSLLLSIRQSLADWLDGFNWTYFGTFTFRKPIMNPLVAKSHFEAFLKPFKANFFCAVERFYLGHECHLHALIFSDAKARDLWRVWFSRYGRARVLSFEPSRGAAYYLTKYVTKELCDWDFSFRDQGNLFFKRV